MCEVAIREKRFLNDDVYRKGYHVNGLRLALEILRFFGKHGIRKAAFNPLCRIYNLSPEISFSCTFIIVVYSK